jgi:LDH2 family malate/lactate/ureidoglycolate dehydrogenase
MDRYSKQDLLKFSQELLIAFGMPRDKADVVAEVLLEADLLGHTTHGMQLLVPYQAAIKNDTMTLEGEAELIQDAGSAITWDGRYLPGPYLVVKAIEKGLERIKEHPVVSLALRRCHHTACLASYLEMATRRGLMMLMYNSDPDHKGVAPFGGKEPLLNPDPIAVGIPTHDDPILIDISTSATSVGRTMRTRKEGKQLPGKWLLSPDGEPTADPEKYFGDPPGTILPLGGADLGYKGFGLMLMVEAMTNALTGWGRKDEPGRWGCNVLIQLVDPGAFGGQEAFLAETSFVARACRENPPIDPNNPVRLPGQAGLAKKRLMQEKGVELAGVIMPRLVKIADELGITPPTPLS